MSGKQDFLDEFSYDRLQDCGVLHKHGTGRFILVSVANYAKNLHAKQKRDNGEPYYNHLLRVASSFADYYDCKKDLAERELDLIVTSFLHDAVEDTGVTFEEVRSFLFNVYPKELSGSHAEEFCIFRVNSIVEALKYLTHIKGEKYFEYVMRIISLNKLALNDVEKYMCPLVLTVLTKLSDIKDNTSEIDSGSRRDKYFLTRYILKNEITYFSELYDVYGL